MFSEAAADGARRPMLRDRQRLQSATAARVAWYLGERCSGMAWDDDPAATERDFTDASPFSHSSRSDKQMVKKPHIPMSPSQLPEQRIVPLADLPDRPEPFESVVGYEEKPPGVRLCNGPKKPTYLGQVEWAWSSMNERIDAYYLHKGRRHWMLWRRWFDDNWEEWHWTPIGYVPRDQATERQASVHLLADFWRFEQRKGQERYHWINETGKLSSSAMRTIGLWVWPGVASGSS